MASRRLLALVPLLSALLCRSASLLRGLPLGLAALGLVGLPAAAEPPPLRIAAVFAATGPRAVTEARLADLLALLVEEANAGGGLGGRRLELQRLDPGAEWRGYVSAAERQLGAAGAEVLFAGGPATARRGLLPVLRRHDRLLFHPLPFEGQESERHILHLGPAPNQQALQALQWAVAPDGLACRRIILIGTDGLRARVTNRILRRYLELNGFAAADVLELYPGDGGIDWPALVRALAAFAGEGARTAVLSTINSGDNLPFYRALGAAGLTADLLPVLSLTVSEAELEALDPLPLVGHLVAAPYFMSVDTAANAAFIEAWQRFRADDGAVTTHGMEAVLIGWRLWTAAVLAAGTTDTGPVLAQLHGRSVPAPVGMPARLEHSHLTARPLLIGEILEDAQVSVLWQSAGPISGDPWSDLLPESEGLVADWSRGCGRCPGAPVR